jgi:putative FmdB family regulatory protein
MPLYEYLCGSCGHKFERIQKFSDGPVKECPSCGGAVEKLPSSPAIQFKGSGFYITDYAKSGAGKEPSAKGPAAEKSAGDSSTGSTPAPSSGEAASSKAPAVAAPAKTETK